MGTPNKRNEISIQDLDGREILKYKHHEALEQQALLQKAIAHAAENQIPLRNAKLTGVKLNNVDLAGIVLDGADLSDAVIRGCNMDWASIIHSNMNGIKVINTSMTKATLDASTFNHGVFYKTNLAQSSVIGTSLFGAQIRSSDLSEIQGPVGITSFEEAFLQNSTLRGAVLSNPYFCRSSINRTDFTDVDFQQGQYQSAKFNLVDFTNAHFNFMHGQEVNFINSNINHALINPANCHLSRFTINGNKYGNLKILPAVINQLAESDFPFVSQSDQSHSPAMLAAISNRDQKQIDGLIKQHFDQFGEHSKYDMQAVNFKGKDLSGLRFNGVDFSGSDFSSAQMNDTDLSSSCIDGAFFFSQEQGKYDRLKLEGGSARNVFFHDVELHDADLTGADLSYSKFSAVNAVGLVLNAAIMHSVKMNEWTCIRAADFDEADLNHVQADNCIIQGHFGAAEINNSHFAQCDLSGSEIDGTVLKNSNFISTDLTNITVTKTDPVNVHFKKADLSGSSMKNLKFLNCDFIESDMSFVSLNGSFFKNSNLNDVHLLKTDASDALFVDSKITKCDVHEVINPTPSLFTSSGLEVESKVCVGDEAKAHLERLRNAIKRDAPILRDNNDLDASF